MKTTAELQARLEEIRRIPPHATARLCRDEVVELIEEILRLREEVPPRLQPEVGATIILSQNELKHLAAPYRPEPVKWITGTPYRNDDRP